MFKTDKKARNFRGQNETKYNRISFLVLSGLPFDKTIENKSEELIKKINYGQREMEVANQENEKKKQANYFKINRISAELN